MCFLFCSAGKIPNIDCDNAKEYKWSKTSNAFTFGSNETGQLGFAVSTDDVDGIFEQVTIPQRNQHTTVDIFVFIGFQETPTALDVLADKQVVSHKSILLMLWWQLDKHLSARCIDTTAVEQCIAGQGRSRRYAQCGGDIGGRRLHLGLQRRRSAGSQRCHPAQGLDVLP